jgi:putative transposase
MSSADTPLPERPCSCDWPLTLAVTNAFALLRLLPMSSRDKDAEILALRHQLSVLQRQLSPDRVRFTPGDRALLAALLHQIPRDLLKGLHLVVRPDTVFRWHRDVIVRRHAQRSRPRHPGRPRTVHSVRVLVLRLVRENPAGGGIAGCTASCWCSG